MKHIVHLLAAIAAFTLLPSCANTASGGTDFSGLGTKVLKLGEIGLSVAAARGDLPPGTVITVAKTVALIREPGSLAEKVVPLSEIGLDEAIARGKVSAGDAILIKEGLAVLKEPTPPPVVPGGVVASTGSK
ncbi:MAG: hypothetical protein V4672_13000 [Verrucomicrobiota bacterium]